MHNEEGRKKWIRENKRIEIPLLGGRG